MTFTVSDMSCQHCVKRISTAIKALNNVESVDIDLDTKKVEVLGSASVDDIMNAIKGAGYTAEVSR